MKSGGPEDRGRGRSDADCADAPDTTLLPTTPEAPPAPGTVAERGARGMAGQETPAGPRLFGRYQVQRKLGSGGMSVVYAAYDPQLDRTVALKVLRPEVWVGREDDARARLLREAQAMARLSHPNVIAVFDAGTVGDETFIAAEFIDGGTARQWLKEEPRRWRDVLDLFVKAGRGLAAAHRAGIVHRDFKPDNVLVGKDGRVLVTDFGIARPAADAVLDRPSATAFRGGLAIDLTRGAVVGTPAYMSPEQHSGQSVDARADVFSYCAALYEGLYGQKPFPGKGPDELAFSSSSGIVRDPPPGTDVPGRLHRVVLRGLSPRASDRYASMEELLLALDREAHRRWGHWLAAAALVGVALLLAGIAGRRVYEQRQCAREADAWHGIWDDGRRASVQRAFAETGAPFAADAWRGVQARLDSYANRWSAMAKASCEATRVRGEQSNPDFELRRICLARRRLEVEQLVDLLTDANAALVERAVEAVDELSPVAPCGFAKVLARVQPQPPAEVRDRVEAIRSRLARARAFLHAARNDTGLQTLGNAAAEARDLRGESLETEALLVEGELRKGAGDARTAERLLFDAVNLGGESGDDEAVALGWVLLSELAGDRMDLDRGQAYVRLASAALARLGEQPEIEVRQLRIAGLLDLWLSRFGLAREKFQRALKLASANFGDASFEAATAHHGLGLVAAAEGRFDEALREYQRARSSAVPFLGEFHPIVAGYDRNIAYALRFLGRDDEAIARYRRSVEVLERALGEDNPSLVLPLMYAGVMFWVAGELDPAEQDLQRARRIAVARLGDSHYDVGLCLANLGAIRYSRGQFRTALPLFEQALTIIEKTLGPEHSDLALPLLGKGCAELALHAPEAARASLERALKIRETIREAPIELALIRFFLGRALWESKGDRKRAKTLIAAAWPRGRVETPGYPRSLAREIEQWMESHPAAVGR